MGLKKRIRIVLEELTQIDSDGGRRWEYNSTNILLGNEYPELCKGVPFISEKSFIKACDKIATYFYQKGINNLIIDLDERNMALAPPKEMTLKEIEKVLGHKVILKEKRR